MIGILGMNMQDGPKIAIDAGRRRRGGAFFHPFDTLGVNRFEVGGIETLNGGPGEEKGGNSKEGEGSHTFILRGNGGFAHGGMMVLNVHGGGPDTRT